MQLIQVLLESMIYVVGPNPMGLGFSKHWWFNVDSGK